MIAFDVPGQPLPAERPRLVKRGKARVWITPDRTLDAETRVADAFRAAYPYWEADPVGRWAIVSMFSRETWGTADVDNLQKVVLDGLSGVLFKDDAQVCTEVAIRRLGVGKGNGATEVAAYRLDLGESATLDLTDPDHGRKPRK